MKTIGLLAINKFGCGYYRCFIPFNKLEQTYSGEFKVEACFTKSLSTIDEEDIKKLEVFIQGKDIVVIQRRTGEAWEFFAKYLKSKGIVVVYELDDTYEGIPLENLKLDAKYMCNSETQHSVHNMLNIADIVTVSTPELADWCSHYCSKDKIHVLLNTLDLTMWPEPVQPATEPSEVTLVGFAGSETHKSDLRELGGSLHTLNSQYNVSRKTKILFGFFGFILPELWGLEPNVAFATGVPFLDYPQKLASLHYNIGLAPLKDCFFNQCKSELRYLEYAALGIPVIATDIAPFRRAIVHDNNGILVKNKPRKWVSAMKRLLADTDFRHYLARNAYKRVRSDYNIEHYISNWYSLYKSL